MRATEEAAFLVVLRQRLDRRDERFCAGQT